MSIAVLTELASAIEQHPESRDGQQTGEREADRYAAPQRSARELRRDSLLSLHIATRYFRRVFSVTR